MTTTELLAPRAIVTDRVTPLDAPVCHLGEGPTYDGVTDTAWWCDIVEKRLYQAKLGTGRVIAHDLPVMASMVGIVDADRLFLATEDGLYLRHIADGRMDLLAPLESDTPVTRSNDGRVHPCGAVWIGTMGKAGEDAAGSIYHFDGRTVTRLYEGISIPNGTCFSPDGRIGYFADSRANTLWRVDIDPRTGRPSGEPKALIRRMNSGAIDGAVTDAEGVIWCAIWGEGRVEAYSPQGEWLRSLAVPATRTTCPVFVGRDYSRLLVTSAHEGMDAAARAADPLHGRTFLVEAEGLRGRAEPRVRLGGAA